ncbi:MAG: hypothetical protein ABH864_03445 [archaeon]
MGVDLGNYCGDIEGHAFVAGCLSREAHQSASPREQYAHARSCSSCMDGINIAVEEHRVVNPKFDHRGYEAVLTGFQHATRDG